MYKIISYGSDKAINLIENKSIIKYLTILMLELILKQYITHLTY